MTNQVNKKIQQFFKHFPSKDYEKGEVVLRAGSSDEYFFFIEHGAVKMTTTSSEGQSLVLHIFNSGSCFSLLTLINDGINRYDFITFAPSTLRKVPQSELKNFFENNLDVVLEFNLRFLKGMQGLLNRIEQSAFVSAYHRVAGLLLYFAGHFSEHSQSEVHKVIEIRITHQEVAEWLGLSRENVSIQMKQLERDGLIRKQENLVEIIDMNNLEKISLVVSSGHSSRL